MNTDMIPAVPQKVLLLNDCKTLGTKTWKCNILNSI